jgi:hypothetical protein
MYIGFPSIFLYLFAHLLLFFTAYLFTTYFTLFFDSFVFFLFILHLRSSDFYLIPYSNQDRCYDFFPPVSCHSSRPSSHRQTGSRIARRSAHRPPVLHPALRPVLQPVLRPVPLPVHHPVLHPDLLSSG